MRRFIALHFLYIITPVCSKRGWLCRRGISGNITALRALDSNVREDSGTAQRVLIPPSNVSVSVDRHDSTVQKSAFLYILLPTS